MEKILLHSTLCVKAREKVTSVGPASRRRDLCRGPGLKPPEVTCVSSSNRLSPRPPWAAVALVTWSGYLHVCSETREDDRRPTANNKDQTSGRDTELRWRGAPWGPHSRTPTPALLPPLSRQHPPPQGSVQDIQGPGRTHLCRSKWSTCASEPFRMHRRCFLTAWNQGRGCRPTLSRQPDRTLF